MSADDPAVPLAHSIAPPRIDPHRTPFRETAAFRRHGLRLDPDPERLAECRRDRWVVKHPRDATAPPVTAVC